MSSSYPYQLCAHPEASIAGSLAIQGHDGVMWRVISRRHKVWLGTGVVTMFGATTASEPISTSIRNHFEGEKVSGLRGP